MNKLLAIVVRTIFSKPRRRWSTRSVVMSLMIVAVVCLEWSNSIVLDLNNYPNQSISNSHEATKLIHSQRQRSNGSKSPYSQSIATFCSVEFSIVILNRFVASIQTSPGQTGKMERKMKSEGDNWSAATLRGTDIWDCLDSNKIDRLHLVQWKRSGDDLHCVSLPDHPHPADQPKH